MKALLEQKPVFDRLADTPILNTNCLWVQETNSSDH